MERHHSDVVGWPSWRRIATAAAVALMACATAVWFTGRVALEVSVEQSFARGKAEAQRYGTLLTTEFHRFDYIPDLLRLHPSIQNVLRDPSDQAYVDGANRYLEAVANASGASNLYLLDVTGRTIATSNWADAKTYLGVNFSFRPYFRNALENKEDRFYGIGTVTGVPGYFFAKSLAQGDVTLGVGVVKVNLESLGIHRVPSVREFLIVDQQGVVVLSTDPAFRYRTMGVLAPDILARMKNTRQYDQISLMPIDLHTEKTIGEGSIVSLPGKTPDAPRLRVLAQHVPFGTSDWKIVVLSDLSDAISFTRWMQTIAALVATTILFFILFVVQRQRAIAFQLSAKDILTRANIELERQVLQRTQALSDTNLQLRETQEIAVHSAKLAAIGQLAAGVTHELNQPLATMRMLSENAQLLIRRSQIKLAAENLNGVIQLIGRMDRLIRELKTFSRKGSNDLQPVSVDASISNGTQILASKFRNAGVRIERHTNDARLLVLADPPRLEQVFVNLLSNAIDAVERVNDPLLTISVHEDDGWILATIADNGTGLPADTMTSIFEPFFSTKEAGAGLGLGLAISVGIVREFGGSITAENGAAAGAQFTVRLPAYPSSGHSPRQQSPQLLPGPTPSSAAETSTSVTS